MCQKATGGPFGAYATFRSCRRRLDPRPAQDLPELRLHPRGFCGDCGTPLTFEAVGGGEHIGLTIVRFRRSRASLPPITADRPRGRRSPGSTDWRTADPTPPRTRPPGGQIRPGGLAPASRPRHRNLAAGRVASPRRTARTATHTTISLCRLILDCGFAATLRRFGDGCGNPPCLLTPRRRGAPRPRPTWSAHRARRYSTLSRRSPWTGRAALRGWLSRGSSPWCRCSFCPGHSRPAGPARWWRGGVQPAHPSNR